MTLNNIEKWCACSG